MKNTMVLLARVIAGVIGFALFGAALALLRVDSAFVGGVVLTASAVIGALAGEHVLKWLKWSQRSGR